MDSPSYSTCVRRDKFPCLGYCKKVDSVASDKVAITSYMKDGCTNNGSEEGTSSL